MQGILIVDKPMDWTSFDVVAKLRGVPLWPSLRVPSTPRSFATTSLSLIHI